jgi:hypothetical protein
LQDPISKKKALHKKGAGEVAQDVGPELKPQYCKKKKKRIRKDGEELTRFSVKGPSFILGLGGGKGPKGTSWN